MRAAMSTDTLKHLRGVLEREEQGSTSDWFLALLVATRLFTLDER